MINFPFLQVYDNPDSPEDTSVLERLGSYVREWDRTQFASSNQFIPSWALAINWESVTHRDYPHLVINHLINNFLSVKLLFTRTYVSLS